jgi:hypothetical protein
VNATQVAGTDPLHRLFNPRTGEHFFTISDDERDNATQNLGYTSEGEACYVSPNDPSGRTPLYHMYETTGDFLNMAEVVRKVLGPWLVAVGAQAPQLQGFRPGTAPHTRR